MPKNRNIYRDVLATNHIRKETEICTTHCLSINNAENIIIIHVIEVYSVVVAHTCDDGDDEDDDDDGGGGGSTPFCIIRI